MDKRSPAMVKRVVGDLGSILADAQERGRWPQNVVRSVGHRKKRREAERRQKHKLKVGVDIPSPAEIKAIVGKLDGRWRPLILTAIFAGLRASELRGLRWEDGDLKRAELHVRQRADKYKTIGKPKETGVPQERTRARISYRRWRIRVSFEHRRARAGASAGRGRRGHQGWQSQVHGHACAAALLRLVVHQP